MQPTDLAILLKKKKKDQTKLYLVKKITVVALNEFSLILYNPILKDFTELGTT